MEIVGNLSKRKIYVFEFEDNYAYVGLSCNPRRRLYSHICDKDSAVYKHISDTGAKYNFKTLTDWLSYDVAGDVEDDYKRREFVRKITKQILRCPCCGTVLRVKSRA